jgi:hypothetical protein
MIVILSCTNPLLILCLLRFWNPGFFWHWTMVTVTSVHLMVARGRTFGVLTLYMSIAITRVTLDELLGLLLY